MFKKSPTDKRNLTKNALFFLLRAPPHHIFTFNSRFLHELNSYMSFKVHLSKSVCEIFHFRFRVVFKKVFVFVQQKACTL